MRAVYIIIGAVGFAIFAFGVVVIATSFATMSFFEPLDWLFRAISVSLICGGVGGNYLWIRKRPMKRILIWGLVSMVSTVSMVALASKESDFRSTPPTDATMKLNFDSNREAFDEVGKYLNEGKGRNPRQYNKLLSKLKLSEDGVYGEEQDIPLRDKFFDYWSYGDDGPLHTDYTHKGYYYSLKAPSKNKCLENGDECNSADFRKISGNWYIYDVYIPG